MSKRLYFKENYSEFCYSLDYHLIENEDSVEIELYEAVKMPIKESGFFWCKEYDAPGESGQGTCGKVCEGYQPKNGKSGCCTHHGPCYEHGGKVKIKL